MNRLTRITAILTHLQSKRIVTAEDLANRFNISRRTVYRDIRTLEEAGVPIGSEIGIGYFIVDGYTLPPISITQDEANALILSEKLIQNQGDVSLIKDFSSLVIKIKSTLRNFQKEKAELLEQRIQPSKQKEKPKSELLRDIQKAIIHRNLLKITYHSLYKNEKTRRDIEPLAIYFTENAWVLVAFCHLRKTIREFRLDRMQSCIAINETFNKHTNFSLDTYFKNLTHTS